MTDKNNSEPSDPLRPTFRCQSAVPRPHTAAHRKYSEYLKKLEEKNKLLKEYRDQHKSNDDYLKQRESGFQLYVNGVHNAPPRRPSSAIRKRIDDRTQTPAPFFSKFSTPTLSKIPNRSNSRRRHWTATAQTTIKTEEGSILTDIHSQSQTSQHRRNEFDSNQITYRLKSSISVDESWMPDWFKNAKSPIKSNENESLSLSLDNLPMVTHLTKSQQQTYRLSTTVGR